MTTIYLVRHAHTEWTGDENRPLSKHGQADVDRVAEFLGELSVSEILVSPALRARQTIAVFATRTGLPVREVDDLRERVLGQFPGDNFEAAVEKTWEDSSFAHPGGEMNSAAQERGLAVVHGVIAEHPDSTVVLATHGNLLALILQHYDTNIDFNFWRALTMPDVYRLEVGTGRPTSIERAWSGR